MCWRGSSPPIIPAHASARHHASRSGHDMGLCHSHQEASCIRGRKKLNLCIFLDVAFEKYSLQTPAHSTQQKLMLFQVPEQPVVTGMIEERRLMPPLTSLPLG